MQRIAIVASGWHFPYHFYKSIDKLKRPEGVQIDKFCIAHRNPIDDKDIKSLGDSPREKLDKILYKKIATEKDIRSLGWDFTLYPNTIGDWGCSNQWLETHDFRDYDLFLFTHDDNYITDKNLLVDVMNSLDKWLILANSTGMPTGSIRGSFEFFKREMLEIMGGKFDLSMTTLTREGKTDTPKDKEALLDWNTTVYPLQKMIAEKNIPVAYLSPYYRVSKYCIEGERGLISKTHGINTQYEEAGLKHFNHV